VTTTCGKCGAIYDAQRPPSWRLVDGVAFHERCADGEPPPGGLDDCLWGPRWRGVRDLAGVARSELRARYIQDDFEPLVWAAVAPRAGTSRWDVTELTDWSSGEPVCLEPPHGPMRHGGFPTRRAARAAAAGAVLERLT
jgi:hypothetical protein